MINMILFNSNKKILIFLILNVIVVTYAKENGNVEKIFLEKKTSDLDTSATGYIYRSDGNGPPMYIKLGNGNIEQYDNMLKRAGVYSELEKSDYRGSPAKSKFPISSYVKPTAGSRTYSPPSVNSEAIKEALRNLPNIDEESDISDDGPSRYFDDSSYEAPQSPYKSNLNEYEEPIYPSSENSHYKSGPSKAYIAPRFEVPSTHEVKFNTRPAPVKYSISAPRFSRPDGTYNEAAEAEETEADGDYESEGDHSGYTGPATFSESYHHHKPEKHHFSKGGGGSFKEGHHSSHGEKGDKGFKKYHDFDEADMGHHGKEGKKGSYDHNTGYKKKQHDEAEKEGEYHKGTHGEKGVKYDESTGHKKGHKTTGYHNVFHKDEYKKEHKFYDDAHKHGHHDKHGGYHKSHGKKHGGKSSGGFYDSGYSDGHKGIKGQFHKGHFDNDHKGHKGASGHESHYNHHEDYGKKAGHDENEKHGYSDHHH